MLALWATLVMLFSWLALIMLKVQVGTIPAILVEIVPMLMVVWSAGCLLLAFFDDGLGNITKYGINDLACGATMVIDMLIFIAAVKIAV
jgi:hypothetical protein